MGCWVLRLIGRESRAGADADFRFEYFSRYGSDGRTRPAAADADLMGVSGNVLVVANVGGVVVPLLSVLYEYPLFLVISLFDVRNKGSTGTAGIATQACSPNLLNSTSCPQSAQ